MWAVCSQAAGRGRSRRKSAMRSTKYEDDKTGALTKGPSQHSHWGLWAQHSRWLPRAQVLSFFCCEAQCSGALPCLMSISTDDRLVAIAPLPPIWYLVGDRGTHLTVWRENKNKTKTQKPPQNSPEPVLIFLTRTCHICLWTDPKQGQECYNQLK